MLRQVKASNRKHRPGDMRAFAFKMDSSEPAVCTKRLTMSLMQNTRLHVYLLRDMMHTCCQTFAYVNNLFFAYDR